MQANLFGELKQPLVAAHGVGVDSMGYLVGLRQRGIRPDLVLHAAVGGEKDETMAYIPVVNEYLRKHWQLELTIVSYVPQDFKHWPPYYSLEENSLTNGTLPSISFGYQKKSCSQKWKVSPQHKYLQEWAPAVEYWAAGGRVKKIIGYDASPADEKRSTYACDPNKVKDDNLYEYWYPLQDWGWDRKRCIAEIQAEGLPVPPKSSCFFCASMRPEEVAALPAKELMRIVRMEARAAPRLQSIKGLWGFDQPASPATPARITKGGKNKGKLIPGRPAREARPGSMTQFIIEKGLLPAAVVDKIVAETPRDLVVYQEAYAKGEVVPPFGRWLNEQLIQIGA